MKQFIFIFAFLFSFVVSADEDVETIDDKVEDFLHSMTIEQKVGQLFIFGFSGTQMTPALKSFLSTYEPGSVIVFKRNILSPKQISVLNKNVQDILKTKAGLPAFIMVDQEGGVVSRIKMNPESPSALSIGMTENPGLAEDVGLHTGRVLRVLGFNFDLAPVVDLSDPDKTQFIGNRSFGINPQAVRKMSQKFAAGLSAAGVIATFKHYPGHGGTVSDTHHEHTQKLESAAELRAKDLVPFTNISSEFFSSAVMVAHISFPAIDPTNMPATFSPKLVTELLLGELNYKGLVLTDDIEMFGASSFKTVGERALHAIEAGNDMVMVAWTRKMQTQAYDAVLKAVKMGRLSESRVDESVRKILFAKLKLEQDHNSEPLAAPELAFEESRKKLAEISDQVASHNTDRAFYLNPNMQGSLKNDKIVPVFTAEPSFYKSFAAASGSVAKHFGLSPSRIPNIEKIMGAKTTRSGIFYVTGSGTAKILNRLKKSTQAKLIVVNCTNPGRISNREKYKGIIDINFVNYDSGAFVAKYLFGEPAQLREPSSGKTVSSF